MWSEDKLSFLLLGPKFVPLTEGDMTQLKIDVLNFSRKILLKAHFHNVEYSDKSLIKPASNFIPTSTKYPVLKSVIRDLEMFANELEDLERTEVTDNLSKEQREGLKLLQRNKDVIYFNSDKGSVPVLLNREFYKQKILEKLSSDKFTQLPRNVDYFILLKLKCFIKKFKDCLTRSERLAITNLDYAATNIYGLPKLHKSKVIKGALKNCSNVILNLPDPEDLSFRIIFGGPKNPLVGLADLLNKILNPYTVKVKSLILNSVDFINKLPTFTEEDLPFIQMWVVDAIDMYSNLDNKFGLEALSYWLKKYPSLRDPRFSLDFVLKAMSLVLENNTGYFNGNYYKQENGTATGIKPAPPYANLAMGYLEIILFYKIKINLGQKVASYFWHQFRRYLDDGQIMWDTRLGNFKNIVYYMNNVHASIKFTSECSSTEVVYLDIRILKGNKGFQTVVYNKETDSDTFLNFNSSHPRHVKENIPFNLARRIRMLTDDDESCRDEMNSLTMKFKNAQYPNGLIRTAVETAFKRDPKDLRKGTSRAADEGDLLTFVHFYDPTLPQIFSEVNKLISRIYTTRDLKPIFGGARIVDSLREPASLTRLLQHSRFDDLSLDVNSTRVTRCGRRGCSSCGEILEVNELYFRNSGITYKIKTKMDCTTRNLIYFILCQGCGHSYVGETVCFYERMNGHRTGQQQEVDIHLSRCGRKFSTCPLFKVKEESKIARLVMEDIFIKMVKPELNKDSRNLLHLN